MQQGCLQQAISEQRQKLVNLRICSQNILKKPILPQAAHQPGNFDFRCLAAGLWL
jgi:hypothetical protein